MGRRKEGQPRKKMGRPTKYTNVLAKEICDTIASTSRSIKSMCAENDHWPDYATINRWRDRDDFCKLYRCAKMKQADFMVDELLQIADDGLNDTYEDEDGNEKTRVDVIQRSKLRVDTRKWIACKVLPKVYGDRTQVDATVNARVQTLTTAVTDPVEASRIYQEIMQTDPT